MPARTSKSRLVERKFAFRRSSEGDANVSASYHRDATTANHPRSFAGRKSSFLRMSLRSSSISSADTPEHIPDIDSATQAVAIRTAEEKKENFRASLPRSLIQAHDARDCVAPFRKDEVSACACGNFSISSASHGLICIFLLQILSLQYHVMNIKYR